MSTIYYVIPDIYSRTLAPKKLLKHLLLGEFKKFKNCIFPIEKPVGGVKVMYQHCLLLQAAGFNAYPLLLGRYRGNFYGYNVATKKYDEIKSQLQDDDIVVVPEIFPQLINKFKKGKKILFIQNWPFIYKQVGPTSSDIEGSYQAFGFDYLMSCTQFLDSLLVRDKADIRYVVSNFIDHTRFKPQPKLRQEGRILALPRKQPNDLKAIVAQLGEYAKNVVYADNLPESELITEYQKADIFLATGYPEGFGLPPLEAMACGCAVVGFTGRGADEFMMHEQTALVADDGDVNTAAQELLRMLRDKPLKEALRARGTAMAERYRSEHSAEQLTRFYTKILKQ